MQDRLGMNLDANLSTVLFPQKDGDASVETKAASKPFGLSGLFLLLLPPEP